MASDQDQSGITCNAAPVTGDTADRGFPGLPCLHCGAFDTTAANLEDLSFYCSDCDCETPLADARDYLDKLVTGWRQVLDWIALAPKVDD
jgi:hypothetical protein